jgi:hypothetical protein
MWTDKCFRLVLNTKLFESMTIEKVNRKSIRLNAQDDGTIKMFLIKVRISLQFHYEDMILNILYFSNKSVVIQTNVKSSHTK